MELMLLFKYAEFPAEAKEVTTTLGSWTGMSNRQQQSGMFERITSPCQEDGRSTSTLKFSTLKLSVTACRLQPLSLIVLSRSTTDQTSDRRPPRKASVQQNKPLPLGCQKLPLCPAKPFPTSSKTDQSLAKAEPISDSGGTSVITYLRRWGGGNPAQQQPEEKSESV